jgi:hypothetical protein
MDERLKQRCSNGLPLQRRRLHGYRMRKMDGNSLIIPSIYTMQSDKSSPSYLDLPPRCAQVQVLESCCTWTHEAYAFGFMLDTPFVVSKGQDPSNASYKLSASTSLPTFHEDEESCRACVIFDAEPQSVQTGGFKKFLYDEGMLRFREDLTFPIKFSSPPFSIRPEIFVSLTQCFGQRDGYFSLGAQKVSPVGFEIACVPGRDMNSQTLHQLQLGSLACSWIAFDPRLNRGFVHGERWIPPQSAASIFIDFVHESITSSTGGHPPEFSLIPRIFLAVGGSSSCTEQCLFSLKTGEVTKTGFELKYHNTNDSVLVRWLAIPSRAKGLD